MDRVRFITIEDKDLESLLQNNGQLIFTEDSSRVFSDLSDVRREVGVPYWETSAERSLIRLLVTTPPLKTSYVVGDEVDTTGVQITGKYSNNDLEDVTADCTFSPDVIAADTTAILVSYGDVHTTIPISIVTLSSISVTTSPTTSSYLRNELLDLTGAVVTASYSDGTTEDVTAKTTFSPADGSVLSTAGTRTVTATYGGKSAITSVSVYNVNSIKVASTPTKSEYTTGQNFDYTGLSVTATGGSVTKDVTDLCTITPANGSKVTDTYGLYTATVSYSGKTGTFNYNVSTIPSNLNQATWTTIQTLIKEGKFGTYYPNGSTKTFTTTDGETITVMAELNTGTGSAAAYYPANTVDFISTKALSRWTAMSGNPYSTSTVHNWLNSTVLNVLPEDLQSVIINKTKGLRYWLYENSKWVQHESTFSAKLWILSLREMYNSFELHRIGDSSLDLYEPASQAKQYSIFTPGFARNAIITTGTIPGGAQRLTSTTIPSQGTNTGIRFVSSEDTPRIVPDWGMNPGQYVIGFRIG